MWLTSHERAEARSRAPDYARYYTQRYGDAAIERLRAKIEHPGTSRYYRRLYRLALAELKRRH